jgi:ligand-binding sensor domain-containing protein/signal transduction histidine kinase
MVFLLLVVRPGSATPYDRQLSEYQKQDWQVEDGLPQGNVRAIAVAPDGRLLIATGRGMAAFDGIRFQQVKVDPHDEVANEPVNALLFARNGDLWIGTDDRGVIHRSGEQAVNVSEAAGLTGERVRAMVEDSSGVIWVATQNGVERFVDGQIECLGTLGIVPGDVTTPFAPDGQGGMFIVTAKGLFRWTAGTVRPVPLLPAELGGPTAVYRDSHGQSWIGAEHGAVRLAPGEGGFAEHTESAIHGPVTVILEDREGNLWFGSRGHGICRLSGQGVTHWTTSDGLGDDNIRSLAEDREGDLWIGKRSGGLSRWRQTTMIPYGAPEGFPQTLASAVLPDASGDLWFGTWEQGVQRLRQGKLEAVPLPGTPRSTPIRALASDRRGGMWIGTWYGGLYHAAGSGVQRYLTGTESLANAVSSLLVDRSGNLWVGTYAGLLKYARGLPERADRQVLLAGVMVTCLTEGPSGEILVGTWQGLYRLRGDFVETLTRKDGLSSNNVVSISVDGEGTVWAGTNAGGLDRIEKLRAYPTAVGEGLVHSVLDDGRGSLWMGTTHGVLRVGRVQLRELSEGRRHSIDLTVFGKNDGMRSSECVGQSQPPAARTADGTLWFATAKGFVHTNPAHMVQPPTLPGPRVAGVTVDHVSRPLNGMILLAPGVNDLEVDYEATRLSNPAQVQFRYRLAGYDTEWTVTSERHILYRHLPPGRYRFELEARDYAGPWSPAATAIELEQRPYIYQRWWFYAMLAAAACGIAGVAIRARFVRAKGRVRLILEERNRIAREWHDTLMADFAAISWQLEATQNCLEESPHKALGPLEMTRTMVKHCQEEARRIIWDLRGGDRPVGLLSEELAKALYTLGTPPGRNTHLEVEGDERRLPPVWVHHLVSIGQEAVNNALRHGAPREVKVVVRFGSDRISMRVQDDGVGFEPPDLPHAAPGHFGLAVMHERARKIGGDLRIHTAPGAGTRIQVDLPAPEAS